MFGKGTTLDIDKEAIKTWLCGFQLQFPVFLTEEKDYKNRHGTAAAGFNQYLNYNTASRKAVKFIWCVFRCLETRDTDGSLTHLREALTVSRPLNNMLLCYNRGKRIFFEDTGEGRRDLKWLGCE